MLLVLVFFVVLLNCFKYYLRYIEIYWKKSFKYKDYEVVLSDFGFCMWKIVNYISIDRLVN